jgi:hypothetical protein
VAKKPSAADDRNIEALSDLSNMAKALLRGPNPAGKRVLAKHLAAKLGLNSSSGSDYIRKQLTGGRPFTEQLLRAVIAETGLQETPEIRDRLVQLWKEAYPGRAGPRDAVAHAATFARPLKTLVAHEHHYIGPNGIPLRHKTHQIIEAIQDGVRTYPYICDTDTAVVRVQQGGRVGALTPYSLGFHRFDLLLSKPLRKGQFHVLKYETRFNYPSAPAPEFRRGVRFHLGILEIRVQFDRHQMPQRVWAVDWPDNDPQTKPTRRSIEHLADDGSVQRIEIELSARAVGYRWSWE